MFVDLGDMGEAGDALGDFGPSSCPLAVVLSPLAVALAVLGNYELYRLG
jgi:hypothetical protein